MKPEDYKPYIRQREKLILAMQQITPEQVLHSKYTVKVHGREYPIEPLAADTTAAYRKRFNQLDRAVKGMLGRTGNTDPVEVTIHYNNGDLTLQIDPTPEQEEAAEYRTLKQLCRWYEDENGSGIWGELGVERPPIGKPSRKATARTTKRQTAAQRSRTSKPKASGSSSRTSRPPATPKRGR